MTSWQPSATMLKLQARAQCVAAIRRFFAKRSILEVETPLLGHATVTDVQLGSISAMLSGKTMYLQTSPEFAMKRLLAAGSGSIYQLCKSFRQDEYGRYHNPEFTMLEWYRVGFSHIELMAEMDEFLQYILKRGPAQYLSYQAAFEHYLGLDPHQAGIVELKSCAESKGLQVIGLNQIDHVDKDTWLQLLLSEYIEPYLGVNQPCFLFDFPASQAALAKVSEKSGVRIAERFEVYVNGVELANGFHELTDMQEQRRRFEKDVAERQSRHLACDMPIDERLLAALASGLPECAGVALGVDRLVMLATQSERLEDVVSFTVDRA
ncbi:elongation factor P--(R)-beta-lysine ligase [Piscirickettsia salmonis]|uniref:elongation factor P--(R)-beta-lysine ligase n=1 Tax=Piscirickettsia salmonis TaxID=1238 RepID=UPI0007C953AE|nr:Elongation factor P--(R)-beta-lysine ligase [Piscirickettsiaceae bacterium NZ-RLO1]